MSKKYSKEAHELAAAMDKNADIDLMLLTIEYHARVIATANLLIEAYQCHLNTTILPAFTKSLNLPNP